MLIQISFVQNKNSIDMEKPSSMGVLYKFDKILLNCSNPKMRIMGEGLCRRTDC